jgi:hypothetical protein
MQKFKIAGLLCVAVLLSFHPAIAAPLAPPVYGSCYQGAVPSPAPTTGQTTVPVCINGVLQSSAVITIGATPIPVALPTSFQTAFPTPIPTATPVPTPAAVSTTVASSASSVTLLAANTAITGAAFCNNSTSIAYISMVTPATSTSLVAALGAEVSGIPFCFIQSNSDLYRGTWYAIWTSANGSMTVTYW